ncbi:hypothetical protein LXL04_039044 [Taraxacum kok-saghyz]
MKSPPSDVSADRFGGVTYTLVGKSDSDTLGAFERYWSAAVTKLSICGARPQMYRSIFLSTGVTICNALIPVICWILLRRGSTFCTSLLGQYSSNIMAFNSSHDIEFAAVIPIV